MCKIIFQVLTAALISSGFARPAIGAQPTVISTNPPAGPVQNLTSITVVFSSIVTGVNAADLTITGMAATSFAGGGDTYTFSFLQPPAGPVQVAWVAGHGIADRAAPPNAFAGGKN